jgi:hypothetical protein
MDKVYVMCYFIFMYARSVKDAVPKNKNEAGNLSIFTDERYWSVWIPSHDPDEVYRPSM